jgi:hypothetical protein
MKNLPILVLISPLTLLTFVGCESSTSNGTPPQDASAETGIDSGHRGGSGGGGGSGGSAGSAGSGGAGTGGSGGQGGSGVGGSGGSGGAGGVDAGRAGSGGAGGVDAGRGGSGGVGGVDGSAGSSGTGGSAGSGMVDSGAPKEAGPDAGPPLIDQPGQDVYACSVTRSASKLAINPWAAPVLLSGDNNDGYLVRVEGNPTSKLVWSTILADGTLGSPATLHDTNPNYVHGLTAARLDDRVTLVWAGGDDSRLSLAQVDRTGTIVTAARMLSLSGMREDYPKLIPSGTGYAMAWVQSDGTSATMSQIKFARLDASGALVGTPVVVAQGSGSKTLASFIALDDGFAIAYTELGPGMYRPRYAAFDSVGNPYRAAVELATLGWAGGLLRRGDRVFAAWTEEFGSYATQRIATGVRVGRFDLRGNLLESHALEAPVWHQQSVDPRWFTAGEDVGLLWSHGIIHYICAGCVPDNHIRFVILGASDMRRRSEVLDLPPPPATKGGLLDPQVAGPLSNLVLVSSVMYHVHAEGGSAAISCLERDR